MFFAKVGEKNKQAKLTELEVREIRSLRTFDKQYWTQERLSRKFKVGQTTISKVLKRDSWTHI